MKPVTLNRDEYYDRVYACWLGKTIGGTLGAPFEGKKEVLSLDYYDPIPDGSIPNDDLDLQLVWLKMLQDRGVKPHLSDFAEYWMKHLSAYPWEEYGYCGRNLERGLRPPISGCFENDFIDQMGSPIRSELWACIAPGNPQLAAEMAWKDAVLDHAGGEGVYGEMFLAALESAAFVEKNPFTLIDIALQMIPSWSAIARAVRMAVWAREHDLSWESAREQILRRFGHPHPCNAPQNLGFIVIGWLWGADFGDRLCKAVNCGYDTDCTGATLGAILGIVGGASDIPDRWSQPVGDKIVLHAFTRNLDAPKTLGDLTDQTVALATLVMAERSKTVDFGEKTHVAGNRLAGLRRSDRARRILERDYEAATLPASKDVEVTLHYFGQPVIRPRLPKLVGISVEQAETPISSKIELVTPLGWKVSLEGSQGLQALFNITADEVQDSNQVRVRFQTDSQSGQADFVFLGPGQSQEWSPGEGVPMCETCHARVESCLCRK
ncbi:MAG: ADP-ribosylglycohydrolase family protein [Armatimonadetes bacterium]|nr:ADP-ribosylglycohydrolase family protein [Armatimonadota bacterium]